MRSLFSVSFLMLAVIGGMVGAGCASRERARMAFRPGDYHKLLENQKARAAVADEALKSLPEMTAEDYERVGDTSFQQGNFSLAFVQYDKAQQLAPTKVRLRYKKGLVFLRKGLADEALHAFQEILSMDTTFALAYEGIGQAFLMQGKMGEAEYHFHRALAFDASLWKSHNALGMIHTHQGYFDEAIASYQSAIALQNENGILFNNLGVSYHRKGDYEHAVGVFLKALNMGYVEAKVYNNLGLSLAKLGRYREAFTAFTKGGDKVKAYNNIGVIYLAEGKYEEATAAFEEALALSSRYYTTASENLRVAQQALGATSPRSFDALPSLAGEKGAQTAR